MGLYLAISINLQLQDGTNGSRTLPAGQYLGYGAAREASGAGNQPRRVPALSLLSPSTSKKVQHIFKTIRTWIAAVNTEPSLRQDPKESPSDACHVGNGIIYTAESDPNEQEADKPVKPVGSGWVIIDQDRKISIEVREPQLKRKLCE